MALTFPSNPTLNQVYSTGSLSWTWNGKSWNNGTSILATSNLVSSSVQFTNGNTTAFDTNSNITVGQITASFAKISGSIFGTASFATNAFSASYAPNIYVLPSNVVSSSAQLSNGGAVAFDTNSNITVNQITASFAKITNLTVEYVTSSVMVITGSNKFGDASNDKQEFTGSVSMSGSLSIVGNVTSNNVLSLASGTVSLPSLILSTDTTSGMYRIGANNIGISISAAKVLDISSTGLSVTGTLSATKGSSGTVLNLLSGNAANYVDISIGRTAQEWYLGLASANNNYATGTVAGDLAFASSGAASLFFGINNSVVGKFTSTGLNSTAIGATTPSTIAATTIGASGTILSTGPALVNSTSAGGFGFTGGNTAFYSFGANTSTAGGFTFQTLSSNASVNVTPLTITATGLAVTGALSSTTGANFATSSGSVGIGTASPGAFLTLSKNADIAIRFDTTDGTATARNWAISSSRNAYGDLAIMQSNALGGNPLSAGTARMYFDQDGLVGIGTSSPASKLHVYGSGEQYIYNQSTTAGCFFRQYPNSGSNAFIENGTVGSTIYFRTSASTSCDTSPVAISSTGLAVTAQGTPTGAYTAAAANINNNSSGYWPLSTSGYDRGYLCRISQTSGLAVYFETSSATTTVNAGQISVSGTGTTYSTSSDYRRKSNVQNLTGSGTFIDALKPRTFDWDTGDKGVGFIAHEFAEVSPSSVNGEKDAVDSDGKPVYQAMQASSAEVIANLVAELQSLRQRVAALESK